MKDDPRTVADGISTPLRHQHKLPVLPVSKADSRCIKSGQFRFFVIFKSMKINAVQPGTVLYVFR
jgi:hypothetical protein